MTRALSLSFLTCLDAAPEEAIRAAAAAGYDHVGLRLLPAAPGGLAFPLMDDPARVEALRALLAETGVSVFDVELIRIGPAFDPAAVLPFLDTAARLGARAILTVGDDPETARLTASFGALCEAAAGFGLTIDLEFMPQSEVADLAAALGILEATGQPNQGVLVDALHVSRAGTRPEEIARIPRGWLHYAQICDGPAEIPTSREALNHAARHARLMPGDGAIDLAALFAALPADLPVAVEAPNDIQSAGLSPADWAARGRAAALRVLEPALADPGRTR